MTTPNFGFKLSTQKRNYANFDKKQSKTLNKLVLGLQVAISNPRLCFDVTTFLPRVANYEISSPAMAGKTWETTVQQ